MKILVLNGPNINMLGIREPGIYGKNTFADLLQLLQDTAKELNIEVEQYQSNHEGDLVDKLQWAFGRIDGPKATAMRGETAMQITPKLWEYMGWIPRMAELLAECRRTRKALPQLNVPTQVFQSKVDELVSFRSCKDWQDHPQMQTTALFHSGHFVYGAEDIPLLQSRLVSLLTNLTN